MDGRRFGACFEQVPKRRFLSHFWIGYDIYKKWDLLQGFDIRNRIIYVMEKNDKDMRRVSR